MMHALKNLQLLPDNDITQHNILRERKLPPVTFLNEEVKRFFVM